MRFRLKPPTTSTSTASTPSQNPTLRNMVSGPYERRRSPRRAGGGRFQDLPVLEMDDSVGVDFEPHVVGDADDRRAMLLGRLVQQAHDHLAVLAVQGRGRFVG